MKWSIHATYPSALPFVSEPIMMIKLCAPASPTNWVVFMIEVYVLFKEHNEHIIYE